MTEMTRQVSEVRYNYGKEDISTDFLINDTDEVKYVSPGDRIAQMVVARYERVEWNEVATLDETERGEGGFGHTGK